MFWNRDSFFIYQNQNGLQSEEEISKNSMKASDIFSCVNIFISL